MTRSRSNCARRRWVSDARGSVTTRIARATPGMVSNVVPLRVAVDPADSVAALLERTSARLRAAMRHQRYRYEDLRRDRGLDQRLVGPEVNVMIFDYDLKFGEHRALVRNLSIGPSDDLSVNVYDRGDGRGLQIDFDANPASPAHQAQVQAFH